MRQMSVWYFDSEHELDAPSKILLDQKLDELFQSEEEPGIYAVVLYNDPVNGFDFVTKVIKDVFGYSTRKAIWLMLKAHFTGKSQLWSGAFNKASEKRKAMVSFGPDPNMVHKGAQALQVTVEIQA